MYGQYWAGPLTTGISGYQINMNANKIPISKAIATLVSTIKWEVHDDYDISTIDWHDEEVAQPSDAAIHAARQQIADEINAKEYVDLRVNGQFENGLNEQGHIVGKNKIADGYPSITDQLDAMWKGGTALEAMQAQISAVKQRFPKPQ